jgi:hypothetical protein
VLLNMLVTRPFQVAGSPERPVAPTTAAAAAASLAVMERAPLETVLLGNTYLDTTRVGFGARAIGGHAPTPGPVPVAWPVRNPAVDGAIVGFRRRDPVDPLVGAADLPSDDVDLASLEGRDGR